ncbi:MAG: SDR family NAD(P)-dependent oxidoreductase [Deltaproteobacteria bacterium]|nr:SDR family NAD(P)-dependent oxidoreductase [Deltaproteobacteria bacterium]MBW2362034.1 SDR family NAD(P)-dependent oxidoreductase [Deltaproteobacteria bacterium]
MRLAGKSAIVTGSTHGIGREIALALAREGARVVVNGRGQGPDGPGTQTEEADAVVREIEKAGGEASACVGPVNDFDFAGEMVQHCEDRFGSVDILINNAGAAGGLSIDLCPPEHWHETIDVNLNGTYYCSHHAAKRMKSQHWGRILGCSSFSHTGFIGGACYPAAKGGIASLARAMARNLGMYGITSNAFCPEARTRMINAGQEGSAIHDSHMASLEKRGFISPEKKRALLDLPGPEGIAPFVVYLCLPEAHYINGQVFNVEGGRIGLVPEPHETRTLARDVERDGIWSVDALCELVPQTVGSGLVNPVPERPLEELEKLMADIPPMFW